VIAPEAGIPLNDLQEQLGHANLATTSIYTKVTPAHVKEVYDKVDFCGVMGLE
jgi:Site-specific recombinase XerC